MLPMSLREFHRAGPGVRPQGIQAFPRHHKAQAGTQAEKDQGLGAGLFSGAPDLKPGRLSSLTDRIFSLPVVCLHPFFKYISGELGDSHAFFTWSAYAKAQYDWQNTMLSLQELLIARRDSMLNEKSHHR